MLHITLRCVLNSLEVETVMTQEVGILRGNDGGGHIGRHSVDRHPMVAQPQLPTLLQLLVTTYEHQRREEDGDEAQRYNRKNRGGEKCHHDSTYQFLKEFQFSIFNFQLVNLSTVNSSSRQLSTRQLVNLTEVFQPQQP